MNIKDRIDINVFCNLLETLASLHVTPMIDRVYFNEEKLEVIITYINGVYKCHVK